MKFINLKKSGSIIIVIAIIAFLIIAYYFLFTDLCVTEKNIINFCLKHFKNCSTTHCVRGNYELQCGVQTEDSTKIITCDCFTCNMK